MKYKGFPEFIKILTKEILTKKIKTDHPLGGKNGGGKKEIKIGGG